MRLLLLASYAPSLLNFRGPLIRAVLARGHEVAVGAPDVPENLRRHLEGINVEVHETPLSRTGRHPLADLVYLRQLRRLIRRVRPDVILTYTVKPNIWGAFAGAAEGVPTVAMVTGLGYAFSDNIRGSRKRIIRHVVTGLYARATARNVKVIFQNPDDCTDFIAAGCLAEPSKARLVNGSGVDMVHYAPAPLAKAPVFLMIARLLISKGVREYSRAAIALRRRHPEARFLLVGPFDEGPDGINRTELDDWTVQGLEYLGPLTDVRPAIAQASVYTLPSYREGTPRSVLEAMAMGRPVITTNAPGCRETIVDGESGWLVPVRDSDALAEAMARFIDEPDLAKRMGAAALSRANEKYDVNKVNAVMIAELGL